MAVGHFHNPTITPSTHSDFWYNYRMFNSPLFLAAAAAAKTGAGKEPVSMVLSSVPGWVIILVAGLVVLRIATMFMPKRKRTRERRRKDKNEDPEIARQRREQRLAAQKGQAISTIAMGVVLIIVMCVLPRVLPAVKSFVSAISSLAIPLAVAMILAGAVRLTFLCKKGKVGELIVSGRLRLGLPDGEYTVIDDVYLPVEGGTTQIDHVVVSRYGVFVVETKNYKGWIFGSADSPTWTQSIYRGKTTFQNPIRQNYRHICAMSENLGLPKEFIHGVVAFTGDCEFKTEMPPGVVYSRRLAGYIRTFTQPVFKDKNVSEIVEVIRLWNESVTPEQRKQHVENLVRSHSAPPSHIG